VIPKLLIIGWGGSAQTYLLRTFNKYTITNHWNDVDTVKHCTYNYFINYNGYGITKELLDKIPIIYVYCNPVDAINSFFRRGFAKQQHYKLTWDQGNTPRSLNWNTDKGYTYPQKSDNILNYMLRVSRTKQDIFGFKNHLEQWLSAKKLLPMELADVIANKEQLSNILNIPINIFNEIKVKPRNTYEPLPSHINAYHEYMDMYHKEYTDIQGIAKKRLTKLLN